MKAERLPHAAPATPPPEHEFEAAPGLPEPLPAGEHIVWQGAPDWRVLARDVMHLRALAVYFGLLLAWRGVTAVTDGGTPAAAAQAVAGLLPLALLALALLATLAWLIARTSLYTVTDKRVVMRIGVVLGITFNLPFTRIESAALRGNADGSGDLSLTLLDDDRIAYLNLWPHARPWQIKRTQPTLRALADARGVAALLGEALADATGVARMPSAVRVPVAPAEPSTTPKPAGPPPSPARHAPQHPVTA